MTYVHPHRGSHTDCTKAIAKPHCRTPRMALRPMEFATSRLDGTLTEDELTNMVAVVIAIIAVCAMFTVVAGLEFGIKTVSCGSFLCSDVLMVVVFALDERWYILSVLVLTIDSHLDHLIEIAFVRKLR